MKYNDNAKKLITKVLDRLNNNNNDNFVAKNIKEAPSELARNYYILQSVSLLHYTKAEYELSSKIRHEIEASNEFTLEDAKFLKKHNGNNPKMVYWNNLIAELENK